MLFATVSSPVCCVSFAVTGRSSWLPLSPSCLERAIRLVGPLCSGALLSFPVFGIRHGDVSLETCYRHVVVVEKLRGPHRWLRHDPDWR